MRKISLANMGQIFFRKTVHEWLLQSDIFVLEKVLDKLILLFCKLNDVVICFISLALIAILDVNSQTPKRYLELQMS